MLLVKLLGALHAEVDGRELELGPPKQRALFAQLAVRRNQVVSRTELIDGVWGEEPPDSVRGIIHTYVSKLRQSLAGERKAAARESLLASVGSGYRLTLEPDNLDLWHFEHAFQQAAQARTANDVERAIEHWDRGLRLWQGEPLPGVPGPFAESERQHLAELRLAAIEDRADTLLSLGRESEVVVDLRTYVEDHPLRERLRALHMIALYRGGRQAEALEHHDRLRRMLAAELGVDPGAEVQAVYQQILANDPALGRPKPRVTVTLPTEEAPTPAREGRSPYPGLLSFSVGNAQYFFGREQLTASLVDRLGDPRRDGPVAVVGASGSGKSSLLRAGLVPTIEGMDLATRRWSWLLFTPGNKPVETLASSLAQGTGQPPSELLAIIREDPAELAGVLDGSERLVVVIDQFEELFTLCEDEAERRMFVEAITALNAAVVYGVRADFYGHCARFPELVASLERAVVVGPMTAAALREAIERPAALAGLELEPGLSDVLLRDLGAEEDTGGVLPLLAHTLLATWQVREGNRLTLQGYAEVGGVHRAIATTADATYARFDPVGRDLVRRLLLRLVHVGEGVEVTRARADRTGLIESASDPETAAAVLDALARARLVTLDEDTAEISHEALLRSWPRLREWVAANREGLRLHQQLAQDARSWQQAGKDDSGLYRGAKLAIAREWADNDALAPVERELLDASAERETAEQQSGVRRTRRLRQLVAALTALLLVAVGSMVFALIEWNTASQQRADALSRQVALRANSMFTADPALAAQLSLVAYRTSPTAEARGSLLTSSGMPAATRLLGHTDGVTALSYGGNLLASASKDKSVRLWDAASRTELATLPVSSAAYGVALSRDGKLLAAGIADGSVILWDVSNPRGPVQLSVGKGHTDSVFSLAFSPDGKQLATGSGDKTVRLWHVDGHQLTSFATLTGHEKIVTSLAYSPDGKLVASGSYDNTVRLWNATTGASAGVLAGHTNAVTGVAFSPDGSRLASASYDESVRIWDPSTGATVSTLPGASSFLEAVAFSPDGRMVAAGGDDHITRIWDAATGTPVASFTAPATIRAVAFSPDGSSVATGAANWTVTVWDVSSAEVLGHAQSGWGIAFDKTGKVLASGHYDGTVRLWGMADPQRPTALATLTGHSGPVTSVAFSPDGKTLASVSYDHTAKLWDVSDPAHPTLLSTVAASSGQLESVIFDPSEKVIVTSGDDHLIRLWDVTDPRHVTPIGQPLTAHTDGVSSLAISADGKTMASGSYDGTARVWDVSDPVHPVSKYPVSATRPAAIRGIALSADGKLLATGGEDHAVELWDVSGAPSLLSTVTDHTNTVTSVALSADGRSLASASWDRTVSTWDISDPRNPKPTASLSGPTGNVTAVAFDPRGGTVAAGVADAPISLWQNDPDVVARQVCKVRGTPVSETEWHTYVNEDSPTDPC